MRGSGSPWIALAVAVNCLLLLAIAGCGTSASARGKAATIASPPALNHVYVVLDEATFAAIRDSEWIRSTFARPDRGLPDFEPPTMESDRLFLRGRHTYLEFFGPDNRFGEPIGKVGLAMGLDEPIDLSLLERTWRRAYGDDVRRTEVAFRRGGAPVPWYDAVQRDATSGNPHLVAWAMTYRPQFVQWQSIGTIGKSITRRADVLAPRWNLDQELLDVIGVSISVPQWLHDALVEQFTLSGLERRDAPRGTTLVGQDWYLVLRVGKDGRHGLESIELGTRLAGRNPSRQAVGNSWLEASSGGGMTWSFQVPSPPMPDR